MDFARVDILHKKTTNVRFYSSYDFLKQGCIAVTLEPIPVGNITSSVTVSRRYAPVTICYVTRGNTILRHDVTPLNNRYVL